MKQPKLYVLVRKDLSKSQQAVQAGHALAQYLLDYPDTQWTNGTLVYLKVLYEELESWIDLLDHCSVFKEPDIGDELTAIATLGSGELFKDLPLL